MINGNFEEVITINSVNDIRKLLDIQTSDGEYLASLVWVGKSLVGKSLGTGEKIYQPAIITTTGENISLSFDGQANYLDNSDSIYMPSHGSIFTMETDKLYFFNNDNDKETPGKVNHKHDLLYNNFSIRMNNISIYRGDFSKGVQLDLRASMEGDWNDEKKSGYVVVLAALDSIN